MTLRKKPLVAIVGRPNVGKSTLFNRLVGERKAVVHYLPGMTRDRHYSDAEYRMRPYVVIDTGGYEDRTDSRLLTQMRIQSIIAMDEADCIIFLTAMQEPDDPVDHEILERLRSSGKPFFLAVNKIDKARYGEAQAFADFSRYGLDEVFPVSAIEGGGVYDLMDAVTEGFEQWDTDEDPITDEIRVAIVGRQNAGKSTLLNRLLGEERVIANPIAGTTRDAIDAEVTIEGQKFVVIDTAGIRRRGKIEKGPEKLSVHSSFRAIERAHVAMLVIDIAEGVTAQDMHVAGYILENKKAAIIVLNKWDLVEERSEAYGRTIREVRRLFNFMPWAPILTVSAVTGQRTTKLWDLIRNCAENYKKEFSTSELNMVLKKAKAYVSPPTHKGNTATLKYVTQTFTQPPSLTLFVNEPKYVHFSYRRYLTNQFMAQLGLEGTPLILRFRRKAPPRGWEATAREDWHHKDKPSKLKPNQNFYAGVYQEGEEANYQFDELPDFSEEEYGKMYYIDDDDDDDGGDDE